MSDELTLRIDPARPAFPQLIDHVIILNTEIQYAFAETYGTFGWQADLSDPAVFWFDRQPPAIFRPHFIGSTSGDSHTWMWGWENINNFPESVVEVATDAKAIGDALQIPELTTAHQQLDPEARASTGLLTVGDADQALVYAAMVQLPLPLYYRAPTGNGSFAWFLLDNADEFTPAAPTQMSAIRAITAAASGGYLTDARAALAGYAQRRDGVSLREDGAAVILTVTDGDVRIEVDDLGRIARVTGTLGGAAPDASPTPSPTPATAPAASAPTAPPAPEPAKRESWLSRLRKR